MVPCDYFEVSFTARVEDYRIFSRAARFEGLTIDRDAHEGFLFGEAQTQLNSGRSLVSFGQRNGCDQLVIATRGDTEIDPAPARRRPVDADWFSRGEPTAGKSAAKIERVFVGILKDEHPAHENWNGQLCGN